MDERRTIVATLMDEALDAELDFGRELPVVWLAAEASTGTADHSSWSDLRRLHLALRTYPSPELPPHFANRTMAMIESRIRTRQSWQTTLLRVGAMIAALATGLLIFALVWGGAVLSARGPVFQAAAAQAFKGLWKAAETLGSSVAQSPWALVLYGLIAGSMAGLWFLALVWPRLILRAGRR